MAFKLINARPSPYGRKVAIALREKGLDYDVQYDVPWGDQTCTPDYSPLQQLPILITEAGQNVYDSAYILDWLEARYPEPALLPAGLEERLAAHQRRLLGERLMEVAQALIFEMVRPDPSGPWIERQSRKIEGVVGELERIYAALPALAERGMDLGDVAVGTTLSGIQFAMTSGIAPDVAVLHWQEGCPTLVKIVAELEKRPSFAATRPAMMDVNLKATMA